MNTKQLQKITHTFPLPRIQTGTPLGNSYLGLLVWGQDKILNLTIGCDALWDHRGGMSWRPEITLENLAAALQAQDMPRIRALFARDASADGNDRKPSLFPVGRLILRLCTDDRLLACEHDLASGLLTVTYGQGDRVSGRVEIRLAMTRHELFACRFSRPDDFVRRLIPSYELSRNSGDPEILGSSKVDPTTARRHAEHQFDYDFDLAKLGIAAPEVSDDYFIQPLPADPAYGVRLCQDGDCLFGQFARGEAGQLGHEFREPLHDWTWEDFTNDDTAWWHDYWRAVPAVFLPNPELQEIYNLGLYKFGAMTAPNGVPAGLQGPWLEDNQMPPWSADYHFNINVEMCYWPALRAGHPENLRHLFDMVWSWRDKLRANAKTFVGIEDGYLLPHAVDDCGTFMGGFWTGCIDHCCATWLAQMMKEYCDYTGDTDYLREVVFEFMKGVMNVHLKMLSREADGSLCHPIGVSPEYRGSSLDAWGKNASFQLAGIHRLAADLIDTARTLNEPVAQDWLDIQEKLPQAALVKNEQGQEEIGLWDGLLLEESHRHHSHLAAIVPFATIDPLSPAWDDIVDRTLERWVVKGMGLWTGWCVPWASMINTRVHNGRMAETMLELWKRCFTNIGGGSLHDADCKGFTYFSHIRQEVMQIDGSQGAVAAVQDMLLYARDGVIYLGAGIPENWEQASFTDMPAPGGLRVTAEFARDKRVKGLTIAATRDAVFAIRLPDEETTRQISLKAGDTWTLKR